MHSASCCFRLPAILASVRTLDTLRLLEHNLRHRITGAYQNRVFRFVFELQRNVSMKTGVDKASVLHCQPCATDGRTPLHKRRKMRRRRWGTPQNCASSTRHAIDQPPSAPNRHPAIGHPPSGTSTSGASGSMTLIVSCKTAPKSAPLLELKAPGTFSQTMKRGRTPPPAIASLLIRKPHFLYKPDLLHEQTRPFSCQPHPLASHR